MAKYLKPRRGSKANAYNQNIKLQEGELFMEFPNGYIGKEPGRLVIGDGASSYQSCNYATSATNVFQPFITDPSIYIPRFANTATSTGSGSVSPAMTSIEKMGNGSSTSTVTLPTIVSAVKEALVYHANSITKLNNDLAGKMSSSGATMTGDLYQGIYNKFTTAGDIVRYSGWINTSTTSLADTIKYLDNNKSNTDHNHDDRYYNKTVINSCTSTLNTNINNKANSSTLSNYTPLSTFNSSTLSLINAISNKSKVSLDRVSESVTVAANSSQEATISDGNPSTSGCVLATLFETGNANVFCFSIHFNTNGKIVVKLRNISSTNQTCNCAINRLWIS